MSRHQWPKTSKGPGTAFYSVHINSAEQPAARCEAFKTKVGVCHDQHVFAKQRLWCTSGRSTQSSSLRMPKQLRDAHPCPTCTRSGMPSPQRADKYAWIIGLLWLLLAHYNAAASLNLNVLVGAGGVIWSSKASSFLSHGLQNPLQSSLIISGPFQVRFCYELFPSLSWSNGVAIDFLHNPLPSPQAMKLISLASHSRSSLEESTVVTCESLFFPSISEAFRVSAAKIQHNARLTERLCMTKQTPMRKRSAKNISTANVAGLFFLASWLLGFLSLTACIWPYSQDCYLHVKLSDPYILLLFRQRRRRRRLLLSITLNGTSSMVIMTVTRWYYRHWPFLLPLLSLSLLATCIMTSCPDRACV